MQESGENYLETILILRQQHGYVRSIDVANHLGFTKASVSRAMGILKESDYIFIEPSGNILLTEKGQKKAEAIYDRHLTISHFLIDVLHIPEETAIHDACRIEHIISEESFQKIKQYVQEHS